MNYLYRDRVLFYTHFDLFYVDQAAQSYRSVHNWLDYNDIPYGLISTIVHIPFGGYAYGQMIHLNVTVCNSTQFPVENLIVHLLRVRLSPLFI